MSPPPQQLELPIDPVLPAIVERLRTSSALVVEAPPGAGKTTRVPRALLESGLCGAGAATREVIVLEPRRLAARLAARRVAEELGEPLGERVGYAVRFEEAGGPRTRLRFVTQGVLLRRMLGDAAAGRPPLTGVAAVVLDEFHERTLEGDLALALVQRARRQGAGVLVVAMSATLDGEPLARWLGGERVRSEGRRFEVAVEHASQVDERPLEARVASAVGRLVAEGLAGDVLVFLPGAREIHRASQSLAGLATRHDLMLVTLHGDQPAAEQERAVRPAPDGRRKVILSTNVAESSVTIDGVVAVVDSGLARIAAHDPWSGLPTLKVAKVSRASATQRAGRAGRTRPGRALRLYTRHDHDSRAEFDAPAVRRADLADALLLLLGLGVEDAAALDWFEAPPPASLDAAGGLLRRLGAIAGTGQLSALGRRLLRFPLHPRLGRLLLEAEARGIAAEGALAAAILAEGRRSGPPPSSPAMVSGPSDLLAAMERAPESPSIDRARRSLASLVSRSTARPPDAATALQMAVLAAFPDRVARRRRAGEPALLLSGGGSASLAASSVVRDPEWMVILEAEERGERGRPGEVVARLASAIEPEWLLDLPEGLREEDEVAWNARAGRVEAVRRLRYDQLILDESPLPEPDPVAVAAVLAEHVLAGAERGQVTADEPGAVDRLVARLAFVEAARPGAGIEVPDEAARANALRSLCVGRRSLSELRSASLAGALRASLAPAQRALLEELAPERLTLPRGRSARIDYQLGQPPSISSRLQDFFGVAHGPRLGDTPLTLHLLAPNQRAVQVTTDLSGFWQRHYPALRRQLMRRYPKHAWPDDPLRPDG